MNSKEKELEKSLINSITLMVNEDETDFCWVEIFEIDEYVRKGYHIFNEVKREIFTKKKKIIDKEIKKITKLNVMVG